MTTPIATYRLQFREGMTFDRARSLIPYWTRLGVSHLYASPIFAATRGSTHGYDVTDANLFDESLGGRDGFERLSGALKAAGIGLILDIVPNHMAASLENPWWRSVVEWGAQSPHARFFDIDWSRPLTLPLLGAAFQDALEAGEISVRIDGETGCLALAYFENAFPLQPSSYALALQGADGVLGAKIAALAASAAAGEDPAFHHTLKTLIADDAAQRAALDRHLETLPAATVSQIHAAQAYRLVHWKVAASSLSYRRFFEVAGLAGLRVEDEAVFEASHRLILDLVKAGTVDGLRIDHVDGLADPAGYLERLRAAVGPDVYIVVEKIIEEEERLAPDWPISGTTGYEFIAALTHLFVDAGKANALDAAYGAFTGSNEDYPAILKRAKRTMVDENFAGEVARLVAIGRKALPDAGDEAAFSEALKALLIAFPVYRTYGTDDALGAQDREILNRVVTDAGKSVSGAARDALAAIAGLLAGGVSNDGLEFRTRFQQLTGPVMAKAMEDTAFYRFHRLIALNEVGGNPVEPDLSVAAFHDLMIRRAEEQPKGMTTTSTHDTKRGEDARARLYGISEAPDVWAAAVDRWHATNAAQIRLLEDGPAPEPALEWCLYQALAGAWPDDLSPDDAQGLKALAERFSAYVEKTIREAKLRTNWSDVVEPYEAAVQAFAARLLSPDNRAFLDDFHKTLAPFIRAGQLNGLTQTLVKMTAPGIPDVYQGSERADLSLVDPDNRRMPDYGAMDRLLDPAAALRLDAASLSSGADKLALTARLIAARRALPALFDEGRYVPLQVTGEGADRIVAYGRLTENAAAIVIAPCGVLPLVSSGVPLAEGFGTVEIALPTALAGRLYSDVLGEGGSIDAKTSLSVQDLAASPFGLLMSGR